MSTDVPASKAHTALMAGIASIPLAFVGVVIGPAFLAATAAGVTGIYLGFTEFRRASRGEIDPGEKAKALGGAAAGGFGCLLQLALVGAVATVVVLLVMNS